MKRSHLLHQHLRRFLFLPLLVKLQDLIQRGCVGRSGVGHRFKQLFPFFRVQHPLYFFEILRNGFPRVRNLLQLALDIVRPVHQEHVPRGAGDDVGVIDDFVGQDRFGELVRQNRMDGTPDRPEPINGKDGNYRQENSSNPETNPQPHSNLHVLEHFFPSLLFRKPIHSDFAASIRIRRA